MEGVKGWNRNETIDATGNAKSVFHLYFLFGFGQAFSETILNVYDGTTMWANWRIKR